MGTVTFSPPFHSPQQVHSQLQAHGFAVLQPADTAAWLGCSVAQLQALQASWDDLPADAHLRDGGRYRFRRHASFEVQGTQVQAVAHRAHWQPVEYNALHGGMERWFAPMQPAMVAQPVWQQLVRQLGVLSQQLMASQGAPATGQAACFVEAHQFRISTADGIGRPTPEGAHRDGVDVVAVFLVRRHAIKGGETRVFEAHGPWGQRFTLTQPWSLLLLDDARMIHETTPIQPLHADTLGWRDTLVVTCRQHGFQGDKEMAQARADAHALGVYQG